MLRLQVFEPPTRAPYHEWACRLDVKEEVLEDEPKTSNGVNFQRKQDHVLVKKDVANDYFDDGGDARC